MSPIRAVNRLVALAGASALGLMLTGCGFGESSSSPSPSASFTTDTFTGSVPVGGSDVHTFTVGHGTDTGVPMSV